MRFRALLGLASAICAVGASSAFGHEYLVRFKSDSPAARAAFVQRQGGRLDLVSRAGMLYKWVSEERADVADVADRNDDVVRYVEPNRTVRIFESPSITRNREALLRAVADGRIQNTRAAEDNPAIKPVPA